MMTFGKYEIFELKMHVQRTFFISLLQSRHRRQPIHQTRLRNRFILIHSIVTLILKRVETEILIQFFFDFDVENPEPTTMNDEEKGIIE